MEGNKDFKPTPAYLRELVLDYLLHNSYVDTARTFAEESASVSSLGGTVESHPSRDGVKTEELVVNADAEMDEPMEDCESDGTDDTDVGALSKETVRIARQRQEIRIHILSGRIEDAMHLLHLHFPRVLQELDDSSTSPPTHSTSHFGFSKIEILNPADSTEQPPQPRKLQFTSLLSTHPVHIALNLRIQDFIESVRTVPLPYVHSRYSSPAEDPLSSDPYADGSLIQLASATASTSQATDANPLNPPVSLHKAQGLYSAVQSLPIPRGKALYLEEVKNVGGLLAYLIPEKSSISAYLSQERRESVADQVNSAILYHLGKPAVSYLELYTRYTTAVWGIMHDMGLPCPQRQSSAIPAPVSNRKLGLLIKNDREEVEIIKPFDLGEFLGS